MPRRCKLEIEYNITKIENVGMVKSRTDKDLQTGQMSGCPWAGALCLGGTEQLETMRV